MIDQDFAIEDYDQAHDEEIDQLLRGLPLHVAEAVRELLVACLNVMIAEDAAPLFGAGQVLGPEMEAFIAEARALPVFIALRHLDGVGVVALNHSDALDEGSHGYGALVGGSITTLLGAVKLSQSLAEIIYATEQMLGAGRADLSSHLDALAAVTADILGGDDHE